MLRARFDESRERLRALVKLMGVYFLWNVSLISHVTKGFVFGGGSEGLVGTPVQFLLRGYGTLPASRIQILKTIAGSPWALKPLIGVLSDTVTLGGYNKMPYIIGSTLLACGACLVMAFVAPLSPTALTLLLFVLFGQVAVADLLVEAKYSQKMRGHEKSGVDLAAFIHSGTSVAVFASIIVCGLLITYVPLSYIYLFPLPVFAALLYVTDANWLDDEEYKRRAAEGEVVTRRARLTNLLGRFCLYHPGGDESPVPIVGFDRQKVATHWRLFTLSGIIGGVSLLTSALGLSGLPPVWLCVCSLLCTALMVAALFVLLEDRQTALIQTYVILQSVCSVSTGAADFFFFTDTAEQYPEGPHFSTFFYVTVMGMVATALHLVGVLFYWLFMSKWRFRSVLYFSNCMLILFSVPNIVLVKRWNVAIGWPDWLFVLGTEALQVVTGAWASMPISLMMFQLCPPGIEAASFAMLAGSSNMGRAVSQYVGAFLLDALAVRPTGAVGESRQFDNLAIVYTIGLFLPLLPLVMIRFLIPDKSQEASLVQSDDDDALDPHTAPTEEASKQEEDEDREWHRVEIT